MKKALIILLAVVLVLALAAGGLGLAWRQAGQAQVPAVAMALLGQRVEPYAWQWHVPVLGGLLTRTLSRNVSTVPAQLGEVTADAVETPTFSQGTATLEVALEGAQVYQGPAEGWAAGTLSPGRYTLRTACDVQAGGEGGLFYHWAEFTVLEPEPEPDPDFDPLTTDWPVPDKPTLDHGRTTLRQGDIFPIQLRGIPDGVTPSLSSDLGAVQFIPMGQGRWVAAIAAGGNRRQHCPTGDYAVRIQAGDTAFNVTVTVVEYDYDVQDLTIDLSDPDISEANSDKAIQEYNNVILALYQQADPERHWEGPFIRPTEGDISTHYGQIRYTNGDYANPTIHWGMDIKNAEGTPIIATNNARVAYADYLLAVGYTVVLEHGGGLKSYHFHMSKLHVEAGQLVEKGQLIGEMGTTGYSTGNHLHFEMRIGSQAISPEFLLEEDAGLYSLAPGDGNG